MCCDEMYCSQGDQSHPSPAGSIIVLTVGGTNNRVGQTNNSTIETLVENIYLDSGEFYTNKKANSLKRGGNIREGRDTS